MDSKYTYGPEKTQPNEPDSQSNEVDACDSNISTETSELVFEPVVNESNVEVQPKVWSDAPIIEEYESDNINGGPVAFGGSKGYITGKAKYKHEIQANIHGGNQATNQNEGSKDKLIQGILNRQMNLLKTVLKFHSGIPILPQTPLSSNRRIEKKSKKGEKVFLDDLARLQRQEKEANEEHNSLKASEHTGENLGDHSFNDTSLSGNEDAMTLQNVYDLCISLCKQVSDQAKEIKLLKAKITKLKRKANPVIKHFKAYQKRISKEQRHQRKHLSKKKKVQIESVSKQGRKNAKGDGTEDKGKTKGRRKIERGGETESESEDVIFHSCEVIQTLENDEELAGKSTKNGKAKGRKNKIAEEEAANVTLS
ncbi:hypothetical protein Tco_0965713 [Tanacetum coccineum]